MCFTPKEDLSVPDEYFYTLSKYGQRNFCKTNQRRNNIWERKKELSLELFAEFQFWKNRFS